MGKLKKILQQTSWQILGKGVTSFSTFIILGLVTRNYGKEGTGIFTLALTYLAIFYLLADFGFNAHVLKKFGVEGSEFTNEWKQLLGTRIMWSMVLVVLAVGLLPFWPFGTFLFSESVLFGSLAITLSAVFVTCNLVFQRKLRYDLSILASSLGTLFSLAVFAVLVLLKVEIPFLLFGHLIGWLAIALIALILSSRAISEAILYGLRRLPRHFVPRNDEWKPIFDFQYSLQLFKETWPVAATLALNVLYFRADSFLIAYFNSVADVGIYNVAYSVFQSALVLPTFIMNSYYPIMLRGLGGAKFVGLIFFGISLLGTGLTLVLSPTIISVLAGKGFEGSITSLQILSLGFPAYFLSSLLMWVLITQGNYKRMFIIYTSGLFLNLAFNFIFIPKYSFIAASWTTVISEYAILLMQVVVLLFEHSENKHLSSRT